MPTVSSKFLPETFTFLSFVNLDWAIVIVDPLAPVEVTAAWAGVEAMSANKREITTRSATRKG